MRWFVISLFHVFSKQFTSTYHYCHFITDAMFKQFHYFYDTPILSFTIGTHSAISTDIFCVFSSIFVVVGSIILTFSFMPAFLLSSKQYSFFSYKSIIF